MGLPGPESIGFKAQARYREGRKSAGAWSLVSSWPLITFTMGFPESQTIGQRAHTRRERGCNEGEDTKERRSQFGGDLEEHKRYC